MDQIEALPISLWREQVPKQRRLLDAVHQVQASHSACRASALQLDHLLGQFVRSFNVARNAISVNDPYVISYVFGSLQGLASEDILPWIGSGKTSTPPDWLNNARDAAKADPEIASANEQYAQRRQELTGAVDALIQELDT